MDLYLIHSPKGGDLLATWDAMLECKRLGLAKAVGVSNFGFEQLRQLRMSGREMPEVNQFELHVWNQQREAVEYMRREGIVIFKRRIYEKEAGSSKAALSHARKATPAGDA